MIACHLFLLYKKEFAKFTRSVLKRISNNSVNEYCYHASVMKYTHVHGERKDRDEKDQ